MDRIGIQNFGEWQAFALAKQFGDGIQFVIASGLRNDYGDDGEALPASSSNRAKEGSLNTG